MPIDIIDYNSSHRDTFRQLNEEWIKKYFTLEASDIKLLSDPEAHILQPGGAIKVAVDDDRVVGVCALLPIDIPPYTHELSKMAVSPDYHGHGIGTRLGLAVIEAAREAGADKLYLESNPVLAPAIALYRKLGFTEVSGIDSPYARCGIQMELEL